MEPDVPAALPLLPVLASAGFGQRRHGGLRVALWDTDFLLNQVRDSLTPSGSLLTGFSGIQLRQYASQHVYTELYRNDSYGHPTKWHKLSEQAVANGAPVPPQTFQEAFQERFLVDITFVEMGDLFTDHPLAVAVRAIRNGKGASDGPTAQLAVLLSRLRPVTYSHDKHLYESGVAPEPSTLPGVRQAEHKVAQGEHIQVGAAGIGFGTVAGIDYLARSVSTYLGVPTWLTRLVTAGVGAWALWNPDRRAAVGRVLGPIGDFVLEHVERAQEGLRHLDEHAVDVEPSDAIQARIAEVSVLRATSRPLLAREIQEGLSSCDPRYEVPSASELRAVLDAAPCFEEGPRWRYSLGHRHE